MWIRFQGKWIQHNNSCFQKNTNGLPCCDGRSFENAWIWKFWNEFLHKVFHYFAVKGASSLVLITLRHGFNKSSNNNHLTPTSLCKALSKLYQNNAINYGNVLDVDSKHWYFILKVDEFLWKIHKKDGKCQHDFAHSTTTCGHSIYDPLISGRKY